jgi:hypothetical protein
MRSKNRSWPPQQTEVGSHRRFDAFEKNGAAIFVEIPVFGRDLRSSFAQSRSATLAGFSERERWQ